MKLIIVSLCTNGIMREHFISYCRAFAKVNEIYCITNDNISNSELNAKETLNLSYKRRNPLGYFSINKMVKMRKFINKVNPDLVYIFTHHATSILMPFILKGRKVIYQVHDPYPHKGVGKLNALIIRLQLKIFAKRAQKLVVAGEAVKRQVLSRCKVDESKIEVIPFAVLDNYINDNISPATENIDLLFYGRIEPYKGIDILFAALEKINIKLNVYIAGTGDILKVYPQIKHIPNNVIILGYVDNNRLIGYIKKCKAVVLPYREASGTMTVCQAFYYGKPVIAADVGVFPEYIQDGGIIFEHGNADSLAAAILLMLDDEKYRFECSRKAKLICTNLFTIDNVCKMHQNMFKTILENKEK